MNTNFKTPILISTLATSLLVLAGCTTQTTTNTNTVTDTNAAVNTNTTNDNANVVVANSNENTNVAVVNENTNSEQGSEVDTSDWLIYTNEVYKFSISYPNNWAIWTDYNPNTEEFSFDNTARHFTLTSSSQLSKDQDFTPGINILIKTNDEIDSLKTELKKANEGSSKTKVDGIDAFVFNKADIVYEQMIIVPEKNMQVIVRVDENYEMSELFKDIYSSIQF